jgi:electron transport complex protein RnfG
MTAPHSHGAPANGAPPPPAPPPQVRASRLLTVLATGGAIAGFLIVVAYGWASPIIEHNKAVALQGAIGEVLKAPAQVDTLFVSGDSLATQIPAGVDPKRVERVYLGYDADHRPIGYAIAVGEPGFADIVRVIFGYDPATKQLIGMKVIESKETPGLGDKIEKDSAFVKQFQDALTPLVGVKPDRHKAGDKTQIDMITGATISSRAVIRIINNALTRLRPALERYSQEAK